MEIKEQIDRAVESVSKDESLLEKFKKDPKGTIKDLFDDKIPDGAMDKIIAGIKEKLADIKDDLPELKEKLPDLKEKLSDVKDDLPNLKEKLPDVKEKLSDIAEDIGKIFKK